MRQKAFNAAQRFRQGENAKAFHETRHVALQFKAQHGAETGLLLLGDVMPGMRGKAGIMHGSHGFVRGQKLRQRLCCFLLRLHAGEKRAKPAQCHVGIKRRAGDTGNIGPGGQCFGIGLFGGDHRPAHHIGMAVEIFGGAVDHKIRAQRNGLLQSGRQKRVVHHQFCRPLPGGDGGDIQNPHQGIAGRFHQYQSGLCRQRCGDRRAIRKIHKAGGQLA